MKKYIKQNDILNSIKNKIKVVSSLPQSSINDEMIIVKYDGFYKYSNNNWIKILSFNTTSNGNPIGELKVVRFPSEVDTNEWLYCDGSIFSSVDFPELYNHLGSNILPDLRGLTLVGVGTNSTNNITSHDVFNLGDCKQLAIQNHAHSMINNCHCHTICCTNVHWCVSNPNYSCCGLHSHSPNPNYTTCSCTACYCYCSGSNGIQTYVATSCYTSSVSVNLGNSSNPFNRGGDFVINGPSNAIVLTENDGADKWDIFNQFRVRYYIKAK